MLWPRILLFGFAELFLGAASAAFLQTNQTSAGAGTFTRDKTGAGPGGANQTSFLEYNCPATATLISGGVAGVDPGTRLSQNSPKSTTASKWCVAWINDGSPDTITLRVVCYTGDLPTHLEEATQDRTSR